MWEKNDAASHHNDHQQQRSSSRSRCCLIAIISCLIVIIIIITTKAYVDAPHLTDYCYFTLYRCACVCGYVGRGCPYGRKVSEEEGEAREEELQRL